MKLRHLHFFFDKDSAARLFKMEGIRLSDDELDYVYSSTGGWVSALRLQISNYRQTGSFDYTTDIDHLVETAIWNRLTPEQRTCLVSMSVMGTFTARQAAIMYGAETLPDHINVLLKNNDFIRYFPREKIYVMHSILQNYLLDQFHQFQPEAFQKRVLHTAGKCCMAEGDYYTAAQFFFKVRDFEALFSIPLNGTYLTGKRENNMIGFLKEIIQECPEEIMCKYPFALLRFSYLFLLDGEYEAYHRLCRIINLVLQSNPAGLDSKELKLLEGEFLLQTSLTAYNDIKKVQAGEKAAYALLGGPTMYRLNDIPITLGATSMLSMFWREVGKLDETLEETQRALPHHIMLTHGQGVGADSTFQAEIMLMRGDDIQAEILCHKALYQARSKQEIFVCLCAEQILARIAILRGNVDGFLTAVENIKGYAKEINYVHILRMTDICLSVISVALDTTDMVAKWFYDVEDIGKKVYAGAVPYVLILYSHLLVRSKQYAAFLGLADNAMNMARERNFIYPQIYYNIYKAEVYFCIGQVQEALENLKEAFAMALPDKIYLPFAQSKFVASLLSKAHVCRPTTKGTYVVLHESESSAPILKTLRLIPGWDEGIESILNLYHRYHKGQMTIINSRKQVQSPLTPREREVAILAKARLSHKEIAEKLYISTATVRTILYNAYSKLGIHSKSELNNIEL